MAIKKHYYLLILYIFLNFGSIFSQDTVFIKSFNIPPVRNIDVLDSKLIIRYKNSYQLFQNGVFEDKIQLPTNVKAYSWVNNLSTNNSIYHTNFFPVEKKIQNKLKYKNLIPGEFSENLSVVTLKNLIYIVWKGKLLEYKINNHYECYFKDHSIRHIFRDTNKLIISTYSGIYSTDINLNVYKKHAAVNYSNGEFCRLPTGDFLCADDLFLLYRDSMFNCWNRNGRENFRKIVFFENKNIALFEHSISEVDLINKNTHIIKRSHNLSDEIIYNNTLYFSSEEGYLYTLKKGKVSKKLKLNVAIYSMVWHNGELLLSCDDGLHIFNKNYKEINFIPLFKALKSIPTQLGIFVTTYEGLFLINLKKNKVYNVIENVEFNRKALTFTSNYLYAGSIQGLYVINLMEFNTNFIDSLSGYPITPETTFIKKPIFIIGILLVLLLFITILIFYLRRSKQAIKKVRLRDTIEKEDLIFDLIYANPSIKSVEDLAIELDVSIPTLITKIKKLTGLSVLEFLKQCKKKIAIDLYENNVTIEEIAKRVGYSVRFVKTNFLKK
jgi:AraC-like DNA-binding protein